MSATEIEKRITELDAEAINSDPGNRKAGQAFALAEQVARQTGESIVSVLERLTHFRGRTA